MNQPAGWLHKDEQAALAELAAGLDCLEVGAWQGLSTTIIGRACRSLVVCDWWKGDEYTEAVAGPVDADDMLARWRRNVRPVADKIAATIVGDMRRTLQLIDPARFGFIFYDADHAGEPTQYAIDWAWRGIQNRIRAGKPFAFALHDYKPRNPKYFAANAAIDEFAASNGLEMQRAGSLAIFTG